MSEASIITGFLRAVRSAKVQVSITGLTSAWFAVHYAAADLPPTQRSILWSAFIAAVTVLLREIVNSWAEEDVARLNNQSPAPTPLPEDQGVPVKTAIVPTTVTYHPTFPPPGAKPGAK